MLGGGREGGDGAGEGWRGVGEGRGAPGLGNGRVWQCRGGDGRGGVGEKTKEVDELAEEEE